LKELYAQIIDQLDERLGEPISDERARLAKIAITQAQQAQMWAVRAITWKD